MLPDRFSIATAQYDVSYFAQFADFEKKLRRWVDEAAASGAKLLVFPEYASMELCSLLPKPLQSDLHGQLAAMQAFLPSYLEVYQALAQQHQLTLVAGSFPAQVEQGGQAYFVNRSYVVHPDGRLDSQDKQIMTRFENEQWHISPGGAIKAINTAVGKIGISICYDSEFPLIARRQVELGADMIIVPSVTDSVSGYHRVRIGSQARALENQCYVIQSALVGDVDWSPAVDVNRGASGVYTPVDHDFPEDGILVRGEMDQASWVYADLDLAALRAVRSGGHVLNYRDWEWQQARLQVE